MKRILTTCGLLVLLIGVTAPSARADDDGDAAAPLAVVMTNDAGANALKVYDARSRALVQTLSTRGQGGVAGNARGVKAYGRLVAAVNFGSGTVAVFRRVGDHLRFDRTVTTTSAPVSVDFGNGHMYVAGATTVDSFVLGRHGVEWMDGSTTLAVAEGGTPPAGSTAQVGVVGADRLLVTLKTDPTPGTVDVIALENGAIKAAAPQAVAAPAGTLTPFGFSVIEDGTAIITLAHSNQDGLFRGASFVDVVDSGENAPCWTTAVGKYVFTANTASRTISRLVSTGSHIFIDAPVAASIPTGSPSDLDADASVMVVLNRAAGQSHLTLLTYNRFGELSPSGSAITVGVPNANGVAIVAGHESDED